MASNVTKNLPRDGDGKLSAYAWPGGYPIYYLDGDNCTLCPACATKFERDEQENFRPVSAGVHWEGEPIQCEQCNAMIDSAYGNPEQPADEKSDLDQHDPVDMSAEAWGEFYAKHPDAPDDAGGE